MIMRNGMRWGGPDGEETSAAEALDAYCALGSLPRPPPASKPRDDQAMVYNSATWAWSAWRDCVLHGLRAQCMPRQTSPVVLG